MKQLLVIFLTLMISLASLAQSGLPVKKISIFKNGTAMIVKEGATPVTGGKASIPVPSHTIYGTYFLGTGKDNPIKNMTVKNDTIKKQEKAQAIWQLIAGNVGKKVTISFSPAQKLDKSVTGKILGYNQQTGLIRVQEDNGKIAALHSTDLYLVEFNEEENKTYMADSIQRSLILTPQNAAENINLEEIYLQTGMNWMPSYFLKLKDDKVARLEMKAMIENFSDGITDAETELIVGSPQMINSGRPDPMTYDYQTLDGTATGGTPAYTHAWSNSTQTKAYNLNPVTMEEVPFDNSFSTSGEKNNDMYIYKIGKVSLGRNSKGIYPIFAGNIEYKDKYEGQVYDKTNYVNTRIANNDETPIDVFHSLEIKNSATVPLTTAPVTIVNEKEQFLAQDEIKYTPVGSSSNIRLSKAVDIIMKNTEEESTRTDNAKKIGKVIYSSVKLKGTITVENFQAKEVTVAVTKDVSGDVSVASDNGKITKQKTYANLNPYTQIKWDVKLSANQKKTVTYEYEVFFTP
ncbi:MAG: hypothetical protein JWO03_2708 [Bacteroidetes bacterium]|nr:hypothetical protein [Bacteroidota bacterium]